MMALRCLTTVAFLAVVSAQPPPSKEATPIDKVISLLEGMKAEVESDGQNEAEAYNEYACFCKKMTEGKSTSIKDGNDNIGVLSSDIADNTQTKKEKSTELLKRKKNQEELSSKLKKEEARCAEEKAAYEADAADLSKAISSLNKAIEAMEKSKPSGPSFLQGSVKQDLMETLAMADAMSMIAKPRRQAVTSMIQGAVSVDPENPEYEYHSNDILDLLQSLLKDFNGQKKTLDGEWAKTKAGCEELQASLKKEMGANADAISALEKEVEKLAGTIASDREALVEAEGLLKDDEQYLKDLTAQCEARAKDYDQRSAMRADELEAMTKALEVLTNDVKHRADEVNQRALLIQKLRKDIPANKHDATKVSKDTEIASKAVKKPISFLQGLLAKSNAKSFLADGSAEKKDRALAFLASEGDRLESFVLSSFAQRSAADPFKKVKGLLQKLIERLLAEATAEATKKGFCDTELGKAYKNRDFRRQETKDLSADLSTLEAKRDFLEEEIKTLGENIENEEIALKETAKERKEQKEDNMKTLKTAKEGFEAVNEALLILKSFYKQAAKAAFVQASPVDEDTTGPGFSGSYKGKQSGTAAVFALLETIASDFDRTIRTTEAAEEAAHRDFVDYTQTAKSSIAAKKTKKELDEADLKTTLNRLESKFEDFKNAQGLLDDALKEIEELKPTCIDTGMSYEKRVEKREEEITALKTALCILDPNGVEKDCALG